MATTLPVVSLSLDKPSDSIATISIATSVTSLSYKHYNNYFMTCLFKTQFSYNSIIIFNLPVTMVIFNTIFVQLNNTYS